MEEDAQLIAASLAGDSAAFGQLVKKYQDRLYNTIVHVVRSADDALDVVQETFVQAFVKLDTFRGSSAFYTWLYRIAFNQAVSQKRRTKTTTSLDQAKESTGSEPLADGGGSDQRILQQERVEQVQAALATLSDEHRTILVLREMDGCDYETIAEILDLPVGTVRSRLHRARLQLRDQLLEVLQNE